MDTSRCTARCGTRSCTRSWRSATSLKNDRRYPQRPPQPASELALPGEMRRQRMAARLIEEGLFFGGRFQQLDILVVDVVAELHGLVGSHPAGQIDPGHRNLPRQMDVGALA